MKLKFPIKRLVGQHLGQIKEWRDVGAAWAEIASELNHSHPGANCIGDSVRKACIALSSDFLRIPKTIEEKYVAAPGNGINSVTSASANLPKADFSRNLKKSEDKHALTLTEAPTSVILPERVPGHVARGRAVLDKGNLTDDELGLT